MKKIFTLITILTCLNTFAQIPTNGLVVHYPFANNVEDASANGFDASETYCAYDNGRDDVANTAVQMDGTYSRVSYDKSANNADFDLQNYSVAVWVKLDAMPNLYANLFEIGQASYLRFLKSGVGEVIIQMGVRTTGLDYAYAEYYGDTANLLLSTFQNSWNHVLLTSNNSSGDREFKLYLNGENVYSSTSDSADIFYDTTDNLLNIGNRDGVSLLSLDGLLQDFCYFNRILTATEISQISETEAAPNSIKGVNGNVSEVSFFPNPANDYINVENLNLGNYIKLVDITGKVIYRGIVKNTTEKIDVQTIDNGIYFLNVLENGVLKASSKLTISK